MFCKDCKYWRRANGVTTTINDKNGRCELISDNNKHDLAFTAYNYDLITKAEFGCVLGEKEKKKK